MDHIIKLPSPPSGMDKWPWKNTSFYSHEKQSFPKISVVTPSYNQGQFIEETIRSVLLQNYPNLEYIIIDGGSTDKTIQIIKKYDPWIIHWVSETDRGQSHAINKGMELATGQLACWLNSDDIFLENGLWELAKCSIEKPKAVAWAGNCHFVDENRVHLKKRVFKVNNQMPLAFCDWGNTAVIPQPGCLFSLEAYKKVGGAKEFLHFAMDVDLWVQLSKVGTFEIVDEYVAEVRVYPEAKTYRADPLSAVEIILINLMENNRSVAQKWIKNKFFRDLFLSLDAKTFFVLSLTWFYRFTVKSQLTRLMKILSNKKR